MSAKEISLNLSPPPIGMRPDPLPAPPMESKTPSGDSIQTEIEQIRRIVNGANKRLERLCEQIADK